MGADLRDGEHVRVMTPLSDNARLVLHEIAAPPSTPVSSAELAVHLADVLSARQIGAALRELRERGYVRPKDAQTGAALVRVGPGAHAAWELLVSPDEAREVSHP